MVEGGAFFVARGFLVCFLDCLVAVFVDEMDVDFDFGEVFGFFELSGWRLSLEGNLFAILSF